MACLKPLDSSAFVPDTALPPASMQAGLRRNDGAFGALPSFMLPGKSGQDAGRHSGAGRNPEGWAAMVNGWQVLPHGALGCRFCGHSRSAGMTYTNYWIPRPSFQTPLYHPALAGTPPEEGNWNCGDPRVSTALLAGTPPEEGNWNHLCHSFQMSLYHDSAELAERPASL